MGFRLIPPVASSVTLALTFILTSQILPVACFGLKSAVRTRTGALGFVERPTRFGRIGLPCGDVLRVRGGSDAADEWEDGDSDAESDAEESSYTDTDESDASSEEAVDPEVVDGPWADAAASAAKTIGSEGETASPDLDQQARSYFLCAVLWSALALDVVLNKSKRAALFAGTAFVSPGGALSATNAVPTASLAGGFALAAGIAALMSRSLTAEAEGQEEDQQGFVRRTRRRLAAGLAMFGAVNLGAHCCRGEFLGMSAAAINGHNALIAVNGWVKDSRGGDGRSFLEEAVADTKESINTLFRGNASGSLSSGDRKKQFQQLFSAAYLLSILSAVFRALNIVRELKMPQSSHSIISSMVSPFASLARYTLGAILGLVLKDAVDSDRVNNHTIVKLNGVVFVCFLSVATVMFFADEATRRITSDAGKLFLIAMLSFTNFIGGFVGKKNSERHAS